MSFRNSITFALTVLLSFWGIWADSADAQDPIRVHVDSLQLPAEVVMNPALTQESLPPEVAADTQQAPMPMVVTTIGPTVTRTDTVAQTFDLPQGHVALVETPDAPRQTRIALPTPSLENVGPENAPPGAASDSMTVNVAPLQVIEHAGSGRLTRRTLVWRAVQGGFVPSETPERFETTVVAWLHDGSASGSTPLAQPVSVVVSAERAVGIQPETVQLRRANDPTNVQIESTPPGDSTWVSLDRVGGTARSTPRRHYLPVLRHRIDAFTASRTEIPGLGLATTTLELSMPQTLPAPVSVSLNAESASIAPSSSRLGPGETATFTVRSWSVGSETIRVTGGPFTDANREVDLVFVFPWLFLGATVLGGLAGGGFRFVQARSQPEDDLPGAKVWGYLATGLLAAVLGAAASAIGINLFSIDAGGTTGPAVVFVIAAASGIAGPSLPFLKTLTG